MTAITEAYVDSLALNAAAAKNGRDLAKKNSFPALRRSEDGTLLFGECKGSGKEPYRCSVDFAKPEAPVYRCSCPSRQFPCKHNLGLLYAYAAGQPFETADVPADIAEKRSKAEQREEKKKEAAQAAATGGEDGAASPAPKRRTNKSALVKKLAAQLEGIDLLDKLVRQTVQAGLASLDAKALKVMEDQAKQLGNYYVPGLQAAFRELLLALRQTDDRERLYTEAMDRLTVLHTLVKKSRDYIAARRDDPDLPPDTESPLEEWIGHAWQLAELREHGLVRTDAELLQLAFRSYADEARGEYVDEGFWVRLDSGELYATRHYRPFRAAKYIKEEDSCYAVVRAKEVFVYPGGRTPRIRFEEMTMREAAPADLAAVKAHAVRSFAEAIKSVKNELKQPLSDKRPIALLRYARLGTVGDRYAIEDGEGKRIALGNIRALSHPVTQLLPLLEKSAAEDQAMLVMFEHDLQDGRLTAQPLAIVTDTESIRFVY
ncbi:SWIM zinc finger family protein [Paenibacillus flagellatus]|uniref:SWIM-type domain-containing protein n=1 Tax=Paenibacillus flagellatus TaxID=2211139 RepID=A0A2V5K955_9BACL|nr:SWIM zinc finger family protein [Paenibacillus flagellatus]PYI50320.1 hypothetical protein DLM86_30080 [Paenibacillus flagellatus]